MFQILNSLRSLLGMSRRSSESIFTSPGKSLVDKYYDDLKDRVDAEFYKSEYPDVAAAGLDPVLHYIKIGAAEGRNPTPEFSTTQYLSANPDVRAAGVNPFWHFVTHGEVEGISRYADMKSDVGGQFDLVRASFDPSFYRAAYPGLSKLSDEEALRHFMVIGFAGGYDPNPSFSTAYYESANADLIKSGLNPFVHYLMYGRQEGRPSAQSNMAARLISESLAGQNRDSGNELPGVAASDLRSAAGNGGLKHKMLPKFTEDYRIVPKGSRSIEIAHLTEILRPSYWNIVDPAPTARVGHLPFMFCLVNLMRPRVYVELGTHHGAGFLGYCQAAKRCALATTAVAVDCREGDEQAGRYDETEFNQFTTRIRKYDEFAGYVRSSLDEVAHRFERKSIDLLHIDGLHTYEAVKHGYETWIDKMSDRGAILFHDIDVHDRDFGVGRFWKELKRQYPTMEFHHSHGLGVAFVGSATGGELPRFIKMLDGPGMEFLQRHFAELGQKSAELAMQRFELSRQEGDDATYATALQELAKARQELAAVVAERDQLRKLFGLGR